MTTPQTTPNNFILLVQWTPNEAWEPSVKSATELADWMRQSEQCGENPPMNILWADENGVVWPVEVKTTTTPFDADDYADATVRFSVNGREVCVASYRVDGRA